MDQKEAEQATERMRELLELQGLGVPTDRQVGGAFDPAEFDREAQRAFDKQVFFRTGVQRNVGRTPWWR